ncbi:MAG: gamma-glutamyltransferase [Myxococcales bacterium]|nr:gamma-glutamyltransferase [Myxococcales bacterium]
MVATTGVIAAGDPRTADAGAEILRAGGNAVDAVVAAACTAFVAEVPLCGPGGSGVLLAGTADDLRVLDFFAAVPGRGLAARPTLDFHDVTVDFGPTVQIFHVGRAAAAVPGTMFGLLEAHRRLGRLPLPVLVEPAVALARAGCTPSAQLAFIIGLLEPIVELTPATHALFVRDGQIFLANPRLADFLEAFAEEGEALLRGPLAQALLDALGPAQGGLLTAEDLEHYAPVWRTPLRVTRGHDQIFTIPPPSSGGPLVGLGLQLSADVPLADLPWLGPRHVCELAALLAAMDGARGRVGPSGVTPEVLEAARAVQQRRTLGSTTHISVLDGEGQLAALTMSNGEGCGHTLEGLGIHVNNFLGEEDINPQGFHRQPPGTWMTTMMAPTAVLHDGRPALVLGTGGSNRIRSALLLSLLHALGSRRSLEEAVVAPRMHVEGDRLWYERADLPPEAEAALRRAWPGATVFEQRNMFFGGVHAVGARDGLRGVGDARRGGAVRSVGVPGPG